MQSYTHLWLGRETFSSMFPCSCMCVCVCACVYAYMCARACVRLLRGIQDLKPDALLNFSFLMRALDQPGKFSCLSGICCSWLHVVQLPYTQRQSSLRAPFAVPLLSHSLPSFPSHGKSEVLQPSAGLRANISFCAKACASPGLPEPLTRTSIQQLPKHASNGSPVMCKIHGNPDR